MTLKKQVEELRQRHAELIQQKQDEAERDKHKHAAFMSRRADGLMKDIYAGLKERIIQSSGLIGETEVRLYIIMNNISATEKPTDVKAVRDLVKERSGIEVRAMFPYAQTNKERYWVLVKMQSEAKAYMLPESEEASETKLRQLDFPALFAENRRRGLLWQKQIKEIAKNAVDKCRELLEAKTDKHYGIEDSVASLSVFDGCYTMDEQVLPYCYLSSSQLADLKKEMNALISGGEIELSKNSEGTARIRAVMMRRPGKVIDGAYFDYGKFCETYDVVTEPLQKIFDEVIAMAELVPAEAQIVNLVPARRLVCRFGYWDGNMNYGSVKRGLEQRRHEKSLIEAVNKAFPAIRVTKISFNTNNTKYYVGSLDMDYKIVDREADFVKEQIAAEEVIKYVKRRMCSRFARAVLGVVMNDVHKVGMTRLFSSNYERRTCYEMKSIEVAVDVVTGGVTKTYKFTLGKIKDEKFIARVERAVNRLTDGLVLLNVSRATYKLNFPGKIGVPPCPLTLEEYDRWVWENS